MTAEENKKETNKQIEEKKDKKAEILQRATDATEVLSALGKNLTTIKDSGFFERMKEGFDSIISTKSQLAIRNGKITGTQQELDDFKQYALNTLEALNERNLLSADAILTVKNNLIYLAEDQSEMKEAITQLAKKTSQNFNNLEKRIERIESNIHLETWIENLKVDDEIKKLPDTIKFLKIIKEFHANKEKQYNESDLKSLKRAFKNAEICTTNDIKLEDFFDLLIEDSLRIDEVELEQLIKVEISEGKILTSEKIANTLSDPIFVAITTLYDSIKRLKAPICALENELKCSVNKAMQIAIKEDIAYGINLKSKVSLFELGVELLSCYSALPELIECNSQKAIESHIETSKFCVFCGKQIDGAQWCGFCGKKQVF
ncbi:hypothetical protein SAMN04487775_10778 [Treponema bryantii]|uniref:Uncharacterized protein n=1 Tax=Treponema bryantii TaxID=163 RepID=A0A1I3LME4_9SPIR|nr:hypothetical protein [Treponema bryantii]SFI85882.1 hypothetical protein SAMN04487775_10778 [Treponema bryantii]